METSRKGRHGQSEESEAVSPSSPDRESEQESPESGDKGEGMSITELVRWLRGKMKLGGKLKSGSGGETKK